MSGYGCAGSQETEVESQEEASVFAFVRFSKPPFPNHAWSNKDHQISADLFLA